MPRQHDGGVVPVAARGGRAPPPAGARACRAGGPRWLETEILAELPGTYANGPLPLSRAERELDLLRPRAEGRPALAAALERALGRCAAMRGDFTTGRGKVAASFAALEELGGDVITIAVHGMTLAELAWLEGDTHAEERHNRAAYERLAEFGERGHRSTLALFLADLMLRLGRDDEVEAYLDESRRLTSPADLVNHVGADAVTALLRARRGEGEEAARLARRALDGALATDSFRCATGPSDHGRGNGGRAAAGGGCRHLEGHARREPGEGVRAARRARTRAPGAARGASVNEQAVVSLQGLRKEFGRGGVVALEGIDLTSGRASSSR